MSKTKQIQEWRNTEDRLFDSRKKFGQSASNDADQARNNRKWDGIQRNLTTTATTLK